MCLTRHAPTLAITLSLACLGVCLNQRPALAQDRAWYLSARPRVQIGALHGTPPYQFSRIQDALRLSDGRVVVMNEVELRYFDAQGNHLRTTGGRGGGPGEFQYPSQIFALPGDSILVWDLPRRTRSWFDHEGSFVRSETIDIQSVAFRNWAAERVLLLPNGSFVAMLITRSATAGGRIYRPPQQYVILNSRGGRIAELGTYLGIAQMRAEVAGRLTSIIQPMGPRTFDAVGPTRIYVGDNAGPEIHIFDLNGRRRGSARVVGVPRVAQVADLQSYRASSLSFARTQADSARIEQQLQVVPMPDRIPAFSALLADSQERLWVREWTSHPRSAARWSVFDKDGRPLGFVAFPARTRPLDAGRDYVIAEYLDEFDVPYAHVYGLSVSRQAR